MFCQVNKCPFRLSLEDYKHYTRAYVKLERLEKIQPRKTNFCGIQIHSNHAVKLQKGSKYREIAIDGKVLRVNLVPNTLNLKIASELTPRFPKRSRMYNNDSFNRSILKQNKENECNSTSKTVSFNNTFYINPISPRQHEKSPTPVKDYEFAYKEYLKSVQMNGACSTPDKEKAAASPSNKSTNEDDDFDEESMEVEYLEEPKRKRGRPKGSGRGRPAAPPMIVRPINSPTKKRGWPLGVSRKNYNQYMRGLPITPRVIPTPAPVAVQTGATTVARKRGRPRKIVAFGFQTIVSDIKTVSLPSDLWSAHVSVTAKKSQVCFTRVVQAVSNTVPVECDRSVKFNGTVNYLVRINNRDVELLAAPPTVNSLRDVEILLEIVNEIGINDPVLEYHNR